MEYVPAVLNGPIVVVPPFTCILLTAGAPCSRSGCGVFPCQVPLARICGKVPLSTSCRLDPFAIVTVFWVKFAILICTTPGVAVALAGVDERRGGTIVATTTAPMTKPTSAARGRPSQFGARLSMYP